MRRRFKSERIEVGTGFRSLRMAVPGAAEKIGWGLAIACVVGVIGYMAILMPDPGIELQPPKLKRETGPLVTDLNWKVSDLDKKPFNLQEFRGKPLFLNLWATWCAPCIAELPSIDHLASNPRLKGKVAFACVAIDDRETLDMVRDFVQQRKLDVPVYYTTKEDIPGIIPLSNLPTTFIIGADGRILHHEEGSALWDSPEVVDILEKYATQKPKAEPKPGEIE